MDHVEVQVYLIAGLIQKFVPGQIQLTIWSFQHAPDW